MDVTPLIPEGRQIIQRYGVNGFRVNGVSYEGAIFVSPMKTWNWKAPDQFADLSETDFSALTDEAAEIDVLLLGSGARGEFFPPKLRAALREKGLIVETMDTGAACRTYNVLMAEGRRVTAALMPVK
jgi:uncharacterized protein